MHTNLPMQIRANQAPKSENAIDRRYEYHHKYYEHEVKCHERVVSEYSREILASMRDSIDYSAFSLTRYKNQPFLNSSTRSNLVGYLLMVLNKLKLPTFIFYKAVHYFDRYCLKIIVLPDEAQLSIVACLTIAAKISGCNNCFIFLGSEKSGKKNISTMNMGTRARNQAYGLSKRYRLPKLNALINICGFLFSCTNEMFREMELHVMCVLEWRLHEPSVEDFMVYSQEFRIPHNDDFDMKTELFKIKQFLAYSSCFLFELVGYNLLNMAKAIIDLVNNTYCLTEGSTLYQTMNKSLLGDKYVGYPINYREIYKNLMRSVTRAPPYLMQYFLSHGPKLFHSIVSKQALALDSEVAYLLMLPQSAESSSSSSYDTTEPLTPSWQKNLKYC